MEFDLNVARDLAQRYPRRYDLVDKLGDRFDNVGSALWALHRDGSIDASADDGWWNKMCDATDHYTSADVADLLVRASKQPEMAGLVSDWGSTPSGWNIYTRLFVKAKVDDPEPLIEAFRTVEEPMRSPFGLELAQLGALDVSQLPDDAPERLAKDAVCEVSDQRIAKLMAKVWPLERVGPILNQAAAQSGVELWSIRFLGHSAAFITPDQIARIALNIDYRDTVQEFLDFMDEHPEGLEEAIAAAVGDHEPADFGITTAIGWVARRCHAQGRELDASLAKVFFEEVKRDVPGALLAEMLSGIPLEIREPWVASQFGSWSSAYELLPTTCTPGLAAMAIAEISAMGRGSQNSSITVGTQAIGREHPQLLVDSLGGKKLPQRIFLAEGLAAATDPVAIPRLVDLLKDSIADVREVAVKGLKSFGVAAYDDLAKALSSRKKDVRLAVASVLVDLDDQRVGPLVEKALAKEKDDDVKAALQALVGDEAGTETVEDKIKAARDAVSSDDQGIFDKIWSSVRWKRSTADDGAAGLIEQVGERALVVAYDGLFRSHGKTSPKLALWRGVLDTAPVDEWTGQLAIRMVVGWPIDDGNFDETPEKHEAAIRGAYAHLAEHLGDKAIAGARDVLREADASGNDTLWEVYLTQGWPDPEQLLSEIAAKTDGDVLRLALKHLGETALPAVLESLTSKKAARRVLAAEALRAVPLEGALPAVEKAIAKERGAKVQIALSRAAFALAAVQSPLAGFEATSDQHAALDAQLAAYPGPAPKGVELGELPALSWTSGAPLSAGATQWLLSRLGDEGPKFHDADLAIACRHIDGPARVALLGALEKKFKGEKVAKNGWVLFSTALLADEPIITEYGRDLDDEARHGSSAVAFYKAQVLSRNASAASLTWLDHWSRKARSQGLKARAGEALDELAAIRGITRDEIADRVTSDFGLNTKGELAFPFGERTLVLCLAPDGAVALTLNGKPIKSAPGTRKSDDAAALKERRRELSALRKQIKQATKGAIERLEQAMVTGRLMERATFEDTWGGNGLLACFGRRVVWQLHASDGERRSVRLDESSALADLEDEAVAWPTDATIAVAHALEIPEAERASWSQIMADYELIAPFEQLARPVHSSPESERGLKRVERFENTVFGRLRGTLERRGWKRGAPQDGGGVLWYSKHFPRGEITAVVRMDPGFAIGGYDESYEQKVPSVDFVAGRSDSIAYRPELVPPADVDAIVYSETIGDLEASRST